MRAAILAGLGLLAAPALAGGGAWSWTASNPTDETYVDEPLRLMIDLPDAADAQQLVVRADGREAPFHGARLP